MTDESLKKLGITRCLYDQWLSILNSLWKSLNESLPKRLSIYELANTIILDGCIEYWEVTANFVDAQYIEVVAKNLGQPMIYVRFTGKNEATLIPAVVNTIFYYEQ